ncbi:hypothetical protein G7Z17_g10996 [Cylindrodendrum hubeiense]|uniref:Zn(2)-C6 fungal-type domain-containing protein n=1 Tax=Cylindrodendrum hubeiense TaxID=595255 RepID=A0A9P5GYE5_9HYPO|nr:hypothetical protein G7Z17_g10996 [Cylindrodendrum hubeiense]
MVSSPPSSGLHAPSASTVGPEPTAGDTVAAPLRPHHLRSCIHCRQRKVKCDREHPCSNCVRAKQPCSYPAGRGRAAKRPRKTLEGPLLDRLHRLESIIGTLATQGGARLASGDASPGTDTDTDMLPGSAAAGQPSSSTQAGASHDVLQTPPSASGTASPDASIDQTLGRLMIDDHRSYYVSNIMWANLGNEIEELRDMLQESVSDDERHLPAEFSMPDMASPSGTSSAILGFRAVSHSLLDYHPSLPHAIAILNIFTQNVLPLVHIFHMPTTTRMYWDAIVSLDSLNRNTEALLFAIYYSAVISMDSDQCMSILGTTRKSALDKYRLAIEQALTRANFLNTQSIILLQAAVVFLSALRNEDDSRTTWSLTCLVFHIAQAMGLHRDGTAFGLKPLVIELRRRLWFHICLLDMRSSEFHGYQPIVNEAIFDTKVPLNINDADLTPQMTEPPPEREGATEMTFCLIRCEAMRAGLKVGYTPPSVGVSGPARDGASLINHETVVEELKQRLEERYLRHLDTSVPFMLLSSTVALVFVLSEICSRPPSPECNQAWECVNAVHERWNMKESGKRGNLWRPIKRLMAKARYIREMQNIDPAFYGQQGTAEALSSEDSAPGGGTAFSSLYTPITSTGTYTPLDNIYDAHEMESAEALLDLDLERLEANMFGTMADETSWCWD